MDAGVQRGHRADRSASTPADTTSRSAYIDPAGRQGSGELLERAPRRSEQGPDVDGRRQKSPVGGGHHIMR